MRFNNDLTAEQVRELLNYDPESGILKWHKSRGCRRGGSAAGTVNYKGYLLVAINGTNYRAHRLAWLCVHGRWPGYMIDHRDGNKLNNRLDNLREATHAENMANSTRCNNRHGFRGVSLRRGKYQAEIGNRGRRTHLGTYGTPAEAAAAYRSAARDIYGEFAA